MTAIRVVASPIPVTGAILETYEIRVLTKNPSQAGADSHAAIRRALALANPTEAIVEVWCGARCVYAGNLGTLRFSE